MVVGMYIVKYFELVVSIDYIIHFSANRPFYVVAVFWRMDDI